MADAVAGPPSAAAGASTLVEGWRMALLLLAFATVTFILEKTLHILEHLFKSRRGLAIALEHVKNELLCVGSISLLLSAFQNLLAQICIPLSEPSIYTDRRRRLLGGGSQTYCEPSKQSLWPISLQHDTHIFIFVVACTHIVYGTLTVYLTIWRVKSWRKWEDEAQAQARANGGDMKVMKMPAKFLYRNVGSNPVIHFFLMLFRQYTTSANQTLYYNARLLFIEKNLQADLSYEFNFHDVVIKGLETELMRTLHPEWHLWLIAVIWYAIPPPAYVSFWMYGISVMLIVLVGGKLVDILVQISVQVAVKYGDSVVYGRMAANPRASRELQVLGRSSLRGPVSNSPSIQRRFLDGLGGLLTGRGGAEAHGRAPSNEGIAPAAAKTTANGQGPAATSAFASFVQQLPSRDTVLQMLRSMASELSGGDGGGENRGVVQKLPFARIGSGRAQEPALPEAASQQPEPASEAPLHPQADATAPAVAMESAEPPATQLAPGIGDVPRDATGNSDSGASAPRRLGLARGSAPATVRRPLPQHHLLILPSSGGGAAPTGSAVPWRADAGPSGANRHLSVIAENRSSTLAKDSHSGRQQHHHRHHHHHHHSHPYHEQRQQIDTGMIKGTIDGVATAPQELPAPVGAEQPQLGSGEAPQTQPHAWRSVFEVFQRHPEHRPRALSLRRAFIAMGIGGQEDSTALPSPRQTPRQMEQQQQQQQGRISQERVRITVAADRSPHGSGGAARSRSRNAAARVEEGSEVQTIVRGEPEISTDATAATANTITTALSAESATDATQHGLPGSGDVDGEGSSDEEYSYNSSESGCERGAFQPKRTPSGRRKVVPLFLRPCYCGAKYVDSSSQYVKKLIKRRGDRGLGNLDAKDFFWFKMPRFMTFLFTLAYFQNSLSIAVCIFELAGMQDSINIWQGVMSWSVILQLCLDLLLVPQVSLSVLPLYALIQPLGSHCPKDLLDYAQEEEERRRQKKLRPERRPRRMRVSELSSHVLGDNKTGQGRSFLGRLGNLLRRGKRAPESKAGVSEAAELPASALRARSGSQAAATGPPIGKAYSYVPPRSSVAVPRNHSRAARQFSEVLSGGRPASTAPTLAPSVKLLERQPQPAGQQLNGLGHAVAAASPAATADGKVAVTGADQQSQLPEMLVVVVQPGQEAIRQTAPGHGVSGVNGFQDETASEGPALATAAAVGTSRSDSKRGSLQGVLGGLSRASNGAAPAHEDLSSANADVTSTPAEEV